MMRTLNVIVIAAFFAVNVQGALYDVWNVRQDWDDTNNPFQGAGGGLHDPNFPAWSIHNASVAGYPLHTTYGPIPFIGIFGWHSGSFDGVSLNGTWFGCVPDPNSEKVSGHGPWIVRWTAPDSNGDGSDYWIRINVVHHQLTEVTRRIGIDVKINGTRTALVLTPEHPSTGDFWAVADYGCDPDDAHLAKLDVKRKVSVGDVIDFHQSGNAAYGGSGVGTFSTDTIAVKHDDPPNLVNLTVQVLTVPNAATDPDNSVITPGVGTFEVPLNELASLNAARFVNCPEVLEFVEWQGDGIANPLSSNTTVLMDDNKTVTVVYEDARACGDVCHEIANTDLDGDCITDLSDFAIMAQRWLEDNRLSDDGLPY